METFPLIFFSVMNGLRSEWNANLFGRYCCEPIQTNVSSKETFEGEVSISHAVMLYQFTIWKYCLVPAVSLPSALIHFALDPRAHT